MWAEKRVPHAEKLYSCRAVDAFGCVAGAGRRPAHLQAVSRSALGHRVGDKSLRQDTSCTVNCHVTFPGEGINIASISCTKTVPGGAKDFELCSRTRDNNAVFVKLADAGNSQCIKPLAEQGDAKDEDDDDKLGEQIREQSEETLKMLKKK